MGVSFIHVSTSTFDLSPAVPPLFGNPDPNNYKIITTKQMGEFIILLIIYPDCKNFEGRKILVYKSNLKELKKQKILDPHFSDNSKFLSPIARFEPNQRGWEWAVMFCNQLNKEENND